MTLFTLSVVALFVTSTVAIQELTLGLESCLNTYNTCMSKIFPGRVVSFEILPLFITQETETVCSQEVELKECINKYSSCMSDVLPSTLIDPLLQTITSLCKDVLITTPTLSTTSSTTHTSTPKPSGQNGGSAEKTCGCLTFLCLAVVTLIGTIPFAPFALSW